MAYSSWFLKDMHFEFQQMTSSLLLWEIDYDIWMYNSGCGLVFYELRITSSSCIIQYITCTYGEWRGFWFLTFLIYDLCF